MLLMIVKVCEVSIFLATSSNVILQLPCRNYTRASQFIKRPGFCAGVHYHGSDRCLGYWQSIVAKM